MGKRKINITSPTYNYRQIQIAKMKASYPHFRSYVAGGRLFFVGKIQASYEMPEYEIRIEYRFDKMPKVKVLAPILVSNCPHYYKKEDCICLYKPENFKWSASISLADYIVSWTTCWLYFYDIWKDCGKWLGPEALHEGNKLKE
jgi:hypothetical protein